MLFRDGKAVTLTQTENEHGLKFYLIHYPRGNQKDATINLKEKPKDRHIYGSGVLK